MKAATEKILDLSGRMGLLLMNNGGEVQRAEDIMHRVCLSSKEITSADALATPGWVIITVHAHGQSFTSMTRTKPGRSDLSRVQTVNEIAARIWQAVCKWKKPTAFWTKCSNGPPEDAICSYWAEFWRRCALRFWAGRV